MSNIYQELLNSSKSHATYHAGDIVVLEVCFANSNKTYCYTADSDTYWPGEKMYVNVNDSGKTVTIEKVHYFSPSDYPFHTIPIKSAVRPVSNGYSYSKPRKKKTTSNRKRANRTKQGPNRELPDWLLEDDDETVEASGQSTKTDVEKEPIASHSGTTTSNVLPQHSSYKPTQDNNSVWILILIGFVLISFLYWLVMD